jgi:hypothetical protein
VTGYLPSGDPTPPSIVDPDWLRREVAALAELAPIGVELDGQVQVADSTWFLYGHVTYDGEVVVRGYQDAETAWQVLRAVPRHLPTTGPTRRPPS